MVQKCKLPDGFNMKAYLQAFRKLAPIPGIKENMSDELTAYTANCVFCKYCEQLQQDGAAKKSGTIWIILSSEKPILAKLNLLPIAIYSGAEIIFVDALP